MYKARRKLRIVFKSAKNELCNDFAQLIFIRRMVNIKRWLRSNRIGIFNGSFNKRKLDRFS